MQGLYHNLKANEAEAAISMFSTWTSDYTNKGRSAGLFISICGAGKGVSRKKLDPLYIYIFIYIYICFLV